MLTNVGAVRTLRRGMMIVSPKPRNTQSFPARGTPIATPSPSFRPCIAAAPVEEDVTEPVREATATEEPASEANPALESVDAAADPIEDDEAEPAVGEY